MSGKKSILRFGSAVLSTLLFTGGAFVLSDELSLNFSTEAFAELVAEHGGTSDTLNQTEPHSRDHTATAWFVDGKDVFVPEGRRRVEIAVGFEVLLPGTHTLDFTTVDGTATSPGDYTSTSQQIQFSDDETSAMLTIPIGWNGDDKEPLETFSVIMSSPNSDITLKGNTTLNITIVDGPFIEVSDAIIEFPPHLTTPGPSREKCITITNRGQTPLNFIGDKISIVGDHRADFQLYMYGSGEVLTAYDINYPGFMPKAPDVSPLGLGKSHEFCVAFNPMSLGEKSAFLSIETDSDVNSTLLIPLTGLAYQEDKLTEISHEGQCEILAGNLMTEEWKNYRHRGYENGPTMYSKRDESSLVAKRNPKYNVFQYGYWYSPASIDKPFFEQCDFNGDQKKGEVIFSKWSVSIDGVPEVSEGSERTSIPGYRLRASSPNSIVSSMISISNDTATTTMLSPINTTREFSTFHTNPLSALHVDAITNNILNKNYIYSLEFLSTRPDIHSDEVEVSLVKLENRRYEKSSFEARFNTFAGEEIYYEDFSDPQGHGWQKDQYWDLYPRKYGRKNEEKELDVFSVFSDDGELKINFTGNTCGRYLAAYVKSPPISRLLFKPNLERHDDKKIYMIKAEISIDCPGYDAAVTPAPSIRFRIMANQEGETTNQDFVYIYDVSDNENPHSTYISPGGETHTYTGYLSFPDDWQPSDVVFHVDALFTLPEMPESGSISIDNVGIYEQIDLSGTIRLQSPAMDEKGVYLIPTFDFMTLADGSLTDDDLLVDYYEILVANSIAFQSAGDDHCHSMTIPNSPYTPGGEGASEEISVKFSHVLDPGTVYSWKVRAVDVAGNCIESGILSFETEPQPEDFSSPTNIVATPEYRRNIVTWNPPVWSSPYEHWSNYPVGYTVEVAYLNKEQSGKGVDPSTHNYSEITTELVYGDDFSDGNIRFVDDNIGGEVCTYRVTAYVLTGSGKTIPGRRSSESD